MTNSRELRPRRRSRYHGGKTVKNSSFTNSRVAGNASPQSEAQNHSDVVGAP